jgi:hypothetical protein
LLVHQLIPRQVTHSMSDPRTYSTSYLRSSHGVLIGQRLVVNADSRTRTPVPSQTPV